MYSLHARCDDSLFQTGPREFLVLYPQNHPAEPIGACPGEKWGGVSRGWAMRGTLGSAEG